MIEINNQETLELFNTVLLKRLRVECDKKDRSGIYGMTQKLLAYNSNRIEGSRLTERGRPHRCLRLVQYPQMAIPFSVQRM